MSRKPGPVVDQDEATLQLIRMILLAFRNSNTIHPISLQARKNAQALLGIKTLATTQKICYWQLPPNINLFLEHAGIDPATGYCVDRLKYNRAMHDLESSRAAKLQQLYKDQDADARKDAIRNAMQRFRPTIPPKTTSPAEVIYNHVLNSKIARHLTKEQDDQQL